MKGVLLVLLVTAVTLAAGCAKPTTPEETPTQLIEDITPPPAPTQIIKDITTEEAFALIQDNQDNPDFVIIDVRAPENFAEGHIEKAINLDYQSKTFRYELYKLDKNKTYVVYCAACRHSTSTLAIMKELGFREAYNMLEGINQWQAEGLPTTK
jgi:rhodanese-related sulfurtransferase